MVQDLKGRTSVSRPGIAQARTLPRAPPLAPETGVSSARPPFDAKKDRAHTRLLLTPILEREG